MSGAPCEVVPLADLPRAAQAPLAQIMQDAWPGWYGPGGQGDALADLAARSAPGLPLGWAALQGGAPIGTVAIADHSHGAAPGEGPWLIGLVTAPAWRRRGVGDALVAAAEANGARSATTITAAGLLARRGWRALRTTPDGWQVFSAAPHPRGGCPGH